MKHVVYIIGAGLTKALESSNRIHLMWDFVSVMAEYIGESDGSYDRTILTTLAELENSNVFETTKPEWKELARRVTDFVNDKAELTDGDATSFKRVMQTRQPDNIEKLLEKSLRKGREELGSGFMPQRFNFAINRMFARIGWNANLLCLERLLDVQLQLPDTRHTFVSFNYDLILAVIGRSMPPTDGKQVEFISSWMGKRSHPVDQVTVVNYKAELSYCEHVAQVFGLERLKLVVNDNGFCDYAQRTLGRKSGRL